MLPFDLRNYKICYPDELLMDVKSQSYKDFVVKAYRSDDVSFNGLIVLHHLELLLIQYKLIMLFQIMLFHSQCH